MDSSRQLGTGNEENKISGSYDVNHLGSKNPSYYSRANAAPISPQPASHGEHKMGGNDSKTTSRNLSVLNIKKSSARFLNPINDNTPSGIPKMHGGSLIDKYPLPAKPDIPNHLNLPPRTIRESKNHQLFDKYMKKQNMSAPRKASMDLNGHNKESAAKNNLDQFGGVGSYALPSLNNPAIISRAQPTMSQLSGRKDGSIPASNFSSRKRNNDPMEDPISDSEFDF